ncbi:MAG TPA: nucleotidyl transferase AbiEii/AbiGii toxin family protein [Candidatus Omnitrophota bacterium]|nr:nucleotidyl transferase AbiEii/AbiGii toxin family protein [Candidatus Omnitrophota bacterium]HRY86173.1 nucleotidyl transferase AbiEii/AbiGii toxin family protein [Candidatus Omnitrophota bacterium]
MNADLRNILKAQEQVLKAVAGQMDGFYLVGGTALARGYFHHRESYDLDFFTKDYSVKKIEAAAASIGKRTGKKLKKIVDSKGEKGFLRMRRYAMPLGKGEPLKIDFVEDLADIVKPFKRIGGIDFASLDDIYLRKIYAATGIITGKDRLGKAETKGKRQEARDLFDLYHLSKTYKNLKCFIEEYPERVEIHGLFQWYYSLNKIEMSLGLGDIVTPNPLEFTEISRHFKKEIEDLMREVTGGV